MTRYIQTLWQTETNSFPSKTSIINTVIIPDSATQNQSWQNNFIPSFYRLIRSRMIYRISQVHSRPKVYLTVKWFIHQILQHSTFSQRI